MVHSVFSRVADKYDLMNDVMSFGGCAYRVRRFDFISGRRSPSVERSVCSPNGWVLSYLRMKNVLLPPDTPIQRAEDYEKQPYHILDVAGGTGDITFKLLDHAKAKQARHTPQSGQLVSTHSKTELHYVKTHQLKSVEHPSFASVLFQKYRLD